jgi:hypothetical protein
LNPEKKMSRRLPILGKEKTREAVENTEMKREETVWRRWMLKEGAIIAEQKVSLDISDPFVYDQFSLNAVFVGITFINLPVSVAVLTAYNCAWKEYCSCCYYIAVVIEITYTTPQMMDRKRLEFRLLVLEQRRLAEKVKKIRACKIIQTRVRGFVARIKEGNKMWVILLLQVRNSIVGMMNMKSTANNSQTKNS